MMKVGKEGRILPKRSKKSFKSSRIPPELPKKSPPRREVDHEI
jgi:hypothetical protein